MVIGQHQHAGGELQPLGVRSEERQQINGIGHRAVGG
jgi:hypothetical protein